MNEHINILLVDDDEEDYLITRDTIAEIQSRQKYQLDWVSDYDKALTLIAERKHDIYLIDYKLGPHNGLDIIQKTAGEDFYAPLILLTGLSDWEIDEKAMQYGASDYLVKGTFNADQLNRVLRYNLRDAKYISEIRSLNSDLENRVKERTAELAKVIEQLGRSNKHLQDLLDERELTQRELKKSLEKEKELGNLKARFVTMASHEFRTPLSTILSSTYLLEKYTKPEDEEKRHKHLDRIRLNINNLTEILNDFLSIGKLEDGKVQPEPVAFIFKNLIEEAVHDIEVILKKGQYITLVENGEAADRPVLSDKKLLKNILINLLSNAAKYSEEDREITLTTEIQPRQIVLEVKDQGIGIPDKDQPHLFERFFRAENALNIQGTGLGLNIIKKYLELLGGDIRFSSKLHEGTTFTVTIPTKF